MSSVILHLSVLYATINVVHLPHPHLCGVNADIYYILADANADILL